MPEPPTDLLPLNDTSHAAEALPLDAEPAVRDVTFIVKGTFDLVQGGVATVAEDPLPLCADIQSDPDAESAVLYESDYVPFKSVADALCVGNAHVPLGRFATECNVRFAVGPVDKTIRVVGDRYWTTGLLGFGHFKTKPEPFQSVPVSYDNAYGGKDVGKPKGFRHYKRNRVGKGYSKYGFGVSGAALPNLEDPRRPIRSWRNKRKPMSFGPVGRIWQPRQQLAGTYNRRWLKRRAPEPPTDFDERFYNCAPEDQQIEGYLRGDERVRVENMHPEHAVFESRLPGVRVRCFRDCRVEEYLELIEVPLQLDTLWVDMETLRLVLVWRGREAPKELAESTAYLLVEERVEEPTAPAESYRARFEELLSVAGDAWADEQLAAAEGDAEEPSPPAEPAT
jgi:hypothetical protein